MGSSNKFTSKLYEISRSEPDSESLPMQSEELMRALLRFGSETPDNTNCYNHVEYGVVRERKWGPPTVYGLKLKGKNVLISDMVAKIDTYIANAMQEENPDLSENERDAITRLVVLLLKAFEYPVIDL